jgi:hypothetical protein
LESLAIKNVGKFYGHSIYFAAIYNLWPFVGILVYFPSLGLLYQEKSGNPGVFILPKKVSIFWTGKKISLFKDEE